MGISAIFEMMSQYNRHNFYKNTFCVFHTPEPNEIPLGDPNYISPSGSRYYFNTDGVFRYANHWGRAASCKWRLENRGTLAKNQINNWGFAHWSDFLPDHPHAKIYWISWDQDNNSVAYYHKDSTNYKGEKLRDVTETIRVIRKVRNELKKSEPTISLIKSLLK